MEKNDFVVYSIKLANFLCKKGHKVKNYAINYNNPKLYCYYFENSEKLQQDFTEFKNK